MTLGIGVAIAVYVMFGQGCVVYRAQHGRAGLSDGEAMAVLVFWPIWILAPLRSTIRMEQTMTGCPTPCDADCDADRVLADDESAAWAAIRRDWGREQMDRADERSGVSHER